MDMNRFEEQFSIPDGLSPEGLKAAELVRKLAINGEWDTGGCVTFYSPEEWRDRGEKYGLHSHLIICHDGGDVAPRCNMDYCRYDEWEGFQAEFHKIGMFVEQCTSWYSAVYVG
jgi:hypothetical protein